jgi:hypothetical protein
VSSRPTKGATDEFANLYFPTEHFHRANDVAVDDWNVHPFLVVGETLAKNAAKQDERHRDQRKIEGNKQMETQSFV